jgi:hypothetical protein
VIPAGGCRARRIRVCRPGSSPRHHRTTSSISILTRKTPVKRATRRTPLLTSQSSRFIPRHGCVVLQCTTTAFCTLPKVHIHTVPRVSRLVAATCNQHRLQRRRWTMGVGGCAYITDARTNPTETILGRSLGTSRAPRVAAVIYRHCGCGCWSVRLYRRS